MQLISSNKLPIFYTPSDLSLSQIAAISFSQLFFIRLVRQKNYRINYVFI